MVKVHGRRRGGEGVSTWKGVEGIVKVHGRRRRGEEKVC